MSAQRAASSRRLAAADAAVASRSKQLVCEDLVVCLLGDANEISEYVSDAWVCMERFFRVCVEW